MSKYKFIFIFSFLFSISSAFAQTDTTSTHGIIKISKPKKEKIYIQVYLKTDSYDVSKVNSKVSSNMIYEPFPGVEGYSFPFNYTRYFTEKFKTKEIDLKGTAFDTVRIGIKVLPNGKLYLKDKTHSTIVKDVPTVYDEKVEALELSRLQLDCLDFLKQIKTWEPAYAAIPKQSRFKKEMVIKPHIISIPFIQTLTIVFSTTPFEDDEY